MIHFFLNPKKKYRIQSSSFLFAFLLTLAGNTSPQIQGMKNLDKFDVFESNRKITYGDKFHKQLKNGKYTEIADILNNTGKLKWKNHNLFQDSIHHLYDIHRGIEKFPGFVKQDQREYIQQNADSMIQQMLDLSDYNSKLELLRLFKSLKAMYNKTSKSNIVNSQTMIDTYKTYEDIIKDIISKDQHLQSIDNLHNFDIFESTTIDVLDSEALYRRLDNHQFYIAMQYAEMAKSIQFDGDKLGIIACLLSLYNHKIGARNFAPHVDLGERRYVKRNIDKMFTTILERISDEDKQKFIELAQFEIEKYSQKTDESSQRILKKYQGLLDYTASLDPIIKNLLDLKKFDVLESRTVVELETALKVSPDSKYVDQLFDDYDYSKNDFEVPIIVFEGMMKNTGKMVADYRNLLFRIFRSDDFDKVGFVKRFMTEYNKYTTKQDRIGPTGIHYTGYIDVMLYNDYRTGIDRIKQMDPEIENIIEI